VVVGDHLDFLYGLPGPIPAGIYALEVFGVASGNGGVLEADLDDISDGGKVSPIDVETFTLAVDGGMQSGLLLNVTKSLPLADAGCGDTLRLRLSTPSGPSGGYYGELQPQLTLP